MPRLRRRQFLQLAGASLGAVALNPVALFQQGQQMHRAIAQTTGKKLALLVGINQYPSPIGDLSGCVNDVQLQYELLVHRYGFDPQNIVIVADATVDLPAKALITTPTRQAILDAFQTHLIDQAVPGDAVIFHYSGHGTYVQDPHPISYAQTADFLDFPTYENFEGKNGAIVPIDALAGVAANEANVILGSTIFLLSLALKTDNVTLVMDSCYAGGGVRGNLVYRATLAETTLRPSQVETDYQDALIATLGLTRDRVQALRQAGIAKGVAMTSARATQTAAETTVANFRAGVFTYLLTRYLWQTSTARPLDDAFIDLARITRSEVDAVGDSQNPIYFAQPGSQLETQPPYLMAAIAPAADAVVREVRSDGTVEFWLGGMTPRGLSAAESIFDVINDQGEVLGQVSQTSRSRLLGYGRALDGLTVQPGLLLREQVRGIPADLSLRLGLHDSLGEDTNRVRQALANDERITIVDANGQTDTDYLLGRFNSTAQMEVQRLGYRDRADIQAIESNSIGIFSNALDPLPATFESQYEDIDAAIARLKPRLRLLLASRALKTITNTESSDLQVEVEVSSNQRRSISTARSGSRQGSTATSSQLAQLRIGEELSFRVTNREDRPLYVAVIAIERDGDMYVYHPSHWNAAELEAVLGPGESVTIPKDDDIFYLPIQGPTGYFEVLVIASTEQLQDTLQSLQRLSDRSSALAGRGQLILFNSEAEASRGTNDSAFNIVQNLLGDVDRSARNSSAAPAMRDGQFNADASRLASMSITIEVVE